MTDEGQGLSEQQLDAIFQDFEQILEEDDPAGLASPTDVVGSALKTRGFGIGLGLATAARFARISHGQISMSSRGLGGGTTVSLNFPLRTSVQFDLGKGRRLSSQLVTPPAENMLRRAGVVDGQIIPDRRNNDWPWEPYETGTTSSSLTSSQPLLDQVVSSPSNSMSRQNQYPFPPVTVRDDRPTFSVLIAEDNPLNSRLLETRLKKRGHDVRVAVDGKACFEVVKSSPEIFDVILMDIQVLSSRHILDYFPSSIKLVCQILTTQY
jgi:CheY-like chemotaxis protein